NTHVPAHRRDQLERPLPYTPPRAAFLERPAPEANRDLVYTLTPPPSPGTTGGRLSPLEPFEKLAGVVPLPRGPPGRPWGLFGAAQPPTRGHHPDATPARGGRGGDGHGVASLGLGAVAQARLCA